MCQRDGVASKLAWAALLIALCACSKSKESALGGTAGMAGQSSLAGRGGVDAGGATAAAGADQDAPEDAGASAGGVGGGESSAGAGGADDEEFVNPVAASEGDTDALGRDSDGNGVRDDLQAHLATLSNVESERVLLVSWAREETRMLLLGDDSASTVGSVREQARRAMSVHRCVVSALGSERAQLAATELESALLNNRLRWTAWLAADRKLEGSVLANTACDESLVTP